ncbi:hypothetical protein [Nocardia sp. NPDC050435]|uniref:hypothetical protein n=1 Tax=Nocardia sp. NPDC050435 TaxID=3155040 RepID=UPI0033D6C788
MERLSVVDEIFLRTHRGLGTPIALQGVWRTADRVDPVLLDQLHAALRTGRLGRRVLRARVPGARRAWRPTVRAYPVDYPATPIPGAALLDWADAQGAGLDPEFGPGWRLAAVPVVDGGTLVSLTCSHALADGRGLVHAVDAALARVAAAREDPTAAGMRSGADGTDAVENISAAELSGSMDHLSGAADGPSIPATFGGDSDWIDARRQWWTVLRGTARALRRGIPRRAVTTETEGRELSDRPPRTAILQFPAEDWDRLAAEQGGTANSLFVWLIANLLWDSGFPRERIEASLPVDTRSEPRTDNDLAVTSIGVTRADDPATIREKARVAYEYRMTSPGGMPEEILQVIPDRWAHALARGAGERDILCSNIGSLPDTLLTLGSHRCTGVAARAIHPGLRELPRTRLSGYLCRIGANYTLALVGLDPVFESSTALVELVGRRAGKLPIPIESWQPGA